METVTLKSRIGPFTATYRPIVDGAYEKHVFDWCFDNDFRVAVPKQWWEEISPEFIDRTNNLRYKEAFLEL